MKTLLLSTMLTVFVASMLVAQTPIAHWPLDGDAIDIIGNKQATLQGGVSWISDNERGDCAKFNGTDGYIQLPSVIWESKTDTNTTITCWFNWAGGANWQRVYSLGYLGGTSPLMYFCPRDGATNHTLRVTFHTDNWYDFFGDSFTDFDTITRNQWYFSAVVIKAHTVKVFINENIIMDKSSVPVTPQRIQAADTSNNVLGKSHWADATFNGMIDDFRIYGEALTDEQVLALYSPTAINEISSGLSLDFYGKNGRILYNSIDERSISDISVYNLSGTILFSSNKLSDLTNQRFEPGIYLISVTSGKEHFTKKVALTQ